MAAGWGGSRCAVSVIFGAQIFVWPQLPPAPPTRFFVSGTCQLGNFFSPFQADVCTVYCSEYPSPHSRHWVHSHRNSNHEKDMRCGGASSRIKSCRNTPANKLKRPSHPPK